MSTDELRSSEGSLREPVFYEGPTRSGDDVLMKQRFFTYDTDAGLVSGIHLDVNFTVDQPPSVVWKYYRDFNLWHNSHGYFYPAAIGDLYNDAEGDLGDERFKITIKPADEDPYEWPDEYRVVKVVPERALVLHQIVPDDDRNGGVSPGFHIFMLQEDAEGNSAASVVMEHTMRLGDGAEGDPTQYWRDLAPEYERFWVDVFVAELRKAVRDGS